MPRLAPALLGLLLVACDTTPGATDRAFQASGEVIAMSGGAGGPGNACFTCHGLNGEGDTASTPRLAGLDQGYLQKQMEDYASGLRQDDVMTRVARGLTPDARRAVVGWYASLPVPAPARVAAPPAPPRVWFLGDHRRGITACAACHGAEAQGVGKSYPQLAGQPAPYTLDQIDRWKAGKRRNDPRGVMAAAVQRLSDGEARAIAAWLAALPGTTAVTDAESARTATLAAVSKPAASGEARRPPRSDGG